MQLLELKPGMAVADVGAGFWAWTMGFARWLGPAGRVYATDVGATQLAALRDAVHRERLSTITGLAGAIDATNLPEACCDAILIRDYHHLTQPEAMIRSLAASLPFWADQPRRTMSTIFGRWVSSIRLRDANWGREQ